MKVVVADVLGMCFGVRDALRAIQAIDRPTDVTIHGELVHNETILEGLRGRGFGMVDERARRELPMTPSVLITAHGVSNRERARLERAGKALVDATCPLVTRAHDAAQELQREGRRVLVIGRRRHVEVEGIIGDLDGFEVIQDLEEVKPYPFARLGVVCQTTAPVRMVAQIREAIFRLNPHAEIRFIDTVCLPTKEHQKSLERLLEKVEAMVVVGGRNSNNTRSLAARCRERGLPTYHVQAALDLEPQRFAGIQVVGLTAGTSTLEGTIEEVRRALQAMGPAG
jgi:4-hydroxy-3-methylbut-2-enyl diphosphate reductase